MVVPSPPRFEHHREALGIGEPTPRLSWKTVAPPGWRQAAYELRIARGEDVWHSGRVESPDSVLVPWPDRPLTARETATVWVRLWGRHDDEPGAWSEPGTVEAGLLSPDDWTAVPVGGGWPEDPESDTRRPARVRREFHATARPRSARLYVTAHGLYEVELNGRRVGDDTLSPGWTPYHQRLRYHTYDVTDLVTAGPNAIGAWLGDGWYRGRLGWNGGFRNLYGSDLSLIAQLELRYEDGTLQTVATDATWRAAVGPILHSGLYDGECHDARAEAPGWSSPHHDDSSWSPVRVGSRDPRTLVAPQGPPVRCTEEVAPVAVLTTPSGALVLDFGQNLVGRLRITVAGTGARGSEITIRTAEVLQEGEIYTRPLRGARSTDRYVVRGDARETWEPRFTIHGFRYARIDGWPGDLEAAARRGDVVARVLHTDMARTGWFTSSNELVNRLHENVVWGMRGNFVSIPTDCPQRDERVGWTGDIQVFAPTASFLYDVSGMLAGWLRDVAAEQLPDGTVPWYVPVIPAHERWTPIRPGAVWGDVAVLTPWVLYERFGDAGLLRDQYVSARKWVDLVDRLAGDDHLWNEGFQLGDWLDPTAPPQDPAAARTDRYLVATAYFARSAQRLADIAEVLGERADAEHYGALAARVRDAFASAYVRPDGRMTSDSQTAYALAIVFGLIPDEDRRAAAGRRLVELVAEARNRVATGFAGTNIICDALTEVGAVDTAYDLLLEEECPSWLYAVRQGATTVWERWDSLLPDGTVNPGTMTSFNHYALGSVADWLHRVVAGMRATAPGYRSVLFRPRPRRGFTHAGARHETPYGLTSIEWRLVGDELRVTVVLPTGADGVVELPGQEPVAVLSGQHHFHVRYEAATLDEGR